MKKLLIIIFAFTISAIKCIAQDSSTQKTVKNNLVREWRGFSLNGTNISFNETKKLLQQNAASSASFLKCKKQANISRGLTYSSLILSAASIVCIEKNRPLAVGFLCVSTGVLFLRMPIYSSGQKHFYKAIAQYNKSFL